MEAKKSFRADLERKKLMFAQIGLVMVLSLAFIAFEWSSGDIIINSGFPISDPFIDDEPLVPVSRIETKPQIPPPKPVDLMVIIDNDDDFEGEQAFPTDIEDWGESVPIYDPPPIIDEPDDVPFIVVEEMPEFPGGSSALNRYLATAVKYPVIALENKISGRVYVEFVVNKDGTISNVYVVRGVDPSLDREAVRVVESMPAWKPGKQRNRPVKVQFTVSINFVLQN